MVNSCWSWLVNKTGAQDIALYAMRNSNVICAVVAPTFGDLRRVCLVVHQDCFL